MARITKLELEQLLAASNEQLRIARLKISGLELDLEIANKRIAAGHAIVRELKVAALQAAKPQVIIRKMVPVAKPVVTRFYRGGKLWEKTRTGNTAVEREVLVGAPSPEALNQLVEEYAK